MADGETSCQYARLGLLSLCSQALLPGVPPTPTPAALTFSLSQDGEGRRVLTTADAGHAPERHRRSVSVTCPRKSTGGLALWSVDRAAWAVVWGPDPQNLGSPACGQASLPVATTNGPGMEGALLCALHGQARPHSPKTVQSAEGEEGNEQQERIIVVVRSPCQENYPADAHPSAHKSALESANPAWTRSILQKCLPTALPTASNGFRNKLPNPLQPPPPSSPFNRIPQGPGCGNGRHSVTGTTNLWTGRAGRSVLLGPLLLHGHPPRQSRALALVHGRRLPPLVTRPAAAGGSPAATLCCGQKPSAMRRTGTESTAVVLLLVTHACMGGVGRQ